LHQKVSEISEQNKISGYMSLYKIEPQMIYRAGVVVESKPEKLLEGFQYTQFSGGKYLRFILKGLMRICQKRAEEFLK
jgi:predicted transcriptional regulator YdeE